MAGNMIRNLPMPTIRHDNIEHACVDQGQGHPIVLVHGFPVDHTMWEDQITTLSNDYRVIAPDLRGFGRTPLAASGHEADQVAARGLSMADYAKDLAALLDGLAIAEPVTLAGFSMGGYIAWQFWKKHADRLRAIVLCDTRAAADTDDTRRARLDMAEHVGEWGSERVAEMMLPKLFAPETLENRPDIVEPTRRVISTTDPRAIAAAQRGMADRPGVTDWLPEIDLPALVLVGEHDAISRVEEMRTMAQSLPRAELQVIHAAGHMTPVENPVEVNAALNRFLNRIDIHT